MIAELWEADSETDIEKPSPDGVRVCFKLYTV